MIQEKDFLYRVPVKNALVTTPNQQVRNPEILVDLEGGEFMHGNILDANSTNKLINQSVKDAVDNKLIESGYVTQGLLDAETIRATEQENSLKTLIGAETSARTKGDESLSAKIKAEQTRAEGKEKEISDKLAIVDGDSNTEGSFRKAIADVIAAAPEDLDTLKEIADKLADNDDLHTALNQAITDKADASALLNEVTRATGAESALQAAINTKQDSGNYVPYDASVTGSYQIDKTLAILTNSGTAAFGIESGISVKHDDTHSLGISFAMISLKLNDYSFDLNPGGIKQIGEQYKFDVNGSDGVKFSKGESFAQMTPEGFSSNANGKQVRINPASLYCTDGASSIDITPTSIVFANDGDRITLGRSGVMLPDGDNDHVLTSNGSTINMANYLKESDVSGQFAAKADRSDLMALEQEVADNTIAIAGKQDKGNYVVCSPENKKGYTIDKPILVGNTNHGARLEEGHMTALRGSETTIYGVDGISSNMHRNCLATSDNSFKPISDFVLKTELPTVPTKTSELTNDSKFITAADVGDNNYTLQKGLNVGNKVGNQLTIGHDSIICTAGDGFILDGTGLTFNGRLGTEIPTAGGDFIRISQLASAEDISNLQVGLSKKQDKIKVNSVDVTNLTHANIDQLINIVQELLTALNSSGLIIMGDGLE